MHCSLCVALVTILSYSALSVATSTCATCPAPANSDGTCGVEDVCYFGAPDTATKYDTKAFTVCKYSCTDGAVKQCEYNEHGELINSSSASNGFCGESTDVTSASCPAC